MEPIWELWIQLQLRFTNYQPLADIGSDGGLDDDDISDCGASSVASLPGNNPAVGTGLWSVVSGTGGSFVDPTVYNTEFNGTNGTTYQLEWEITNGACTSSDLMVVTFPLLAQQPGAFTASTTPVCQSTSGVVYTVPNDPSVTYNWSYSGTGATINGTGNSVTVDFDATATSGDLSVTATNGCGTSAARTIAISVTPIMTAGLASATYPVCEYLIAFYYSYNHRSNRYRCSDRSASRRKCCLGGQFNHYQWYTNRGRYI